MVFWLDDDHVITLEAYGYRVIDLTPGAIAPQRDGGVAYVAAAIDARRGLFVMSRRADARALPSVVFVPIRQLVATSP